jgi:hypothetical protein
MSQQNLVDTTMAVQNDAPKKKRAAEAEPKTDKDQNTKKQKPIKKEPITWNDIQTGFTGLMEFAETLSSDEQQGIFEDFQKLFKKVENQYKPDPTQEVTLIDLHCSATNVPDLDIATYLTTSMELLIRSCPGSPKTMKKLKFIVAQDGLSISARVLPALADKMVIQLALEQAQHEFPKFRLRTGPRPVVSDDDDSTVA